MKVLKGGVRIPIEFNMRDESDEYFHVKFTVTFVRFTNTLKNKRAKETKRAAKAIKRELRRMEKAGIGEDDLTEEESDHLEALLATLAELPMTWMTKDIMGWEGLRDMDGNEVKFSKKELTELLDHKPFVDGFHESWSEAHGGVSPEAQVEADSKN